MGDKSPNSNQKKSAQKQVLVSSANAKKLQAMAAKQAALEEMTRPLAFLPDVKIMGDRSGRQLCAGQFTHPVFML